MMKELVDPTSSNPNVDKRVIQGELLNGVAPSKGTPQPKVPSVTTPPDSRNLRGDREIFLDATPKQAEKEDIDEQDTANIEELID